MWMGMGCEATMSLWARAGETATSLFVQFGGTAGGARLGGSRVWGAPCGIGRGSGRLVPWLFRKGTTYGAGLLLRVGPWVAVLDATQWGCGGGKALGAVVVQCRGKVGERVNANAQGLSSISLSPDLKVLVLNIGTPNPIFSCKKVNHRRLFRYGYSRKLLRYIVRGKPPAGRHGRAPPPPLPRGRARNDEEQHNNLVLLLVDVK